MTETEGCALLRTLFEADGLQIVADYPLDLDGTTLVLDGYDPAARIGFEYITRSAGDRHSFTPEVIARLEARMAKGELFLLLIDEDDVDEDAMRFAARHFLSRVKQVRS